MPKKVYLVRHGESEDLIKKLHQSNESELSQRGHRQSGDVALRFKDITIDIIFSSPYSRTFQTAEHISKVTKAPITKNDLLRERKQPHEIIGKERSDPEVIKIKEMINSHRNEPLWHFSDEENFFELKKRVQEMQLFIEQSKYENIVIVSHAVFIKVFTLLAIFGNLLNPDMFLAFYDHVRTSQTGLTMLEFDLNKWKLLTWNDYAHLADDAGGTEYKA